MSDRYHVLTILLTIAITIATWNFYIGFATATLIVAIMRLFKTDMGTYTKEPYKRADYLLDILFVLVVIFGSWAAVKILLASLAVSLTRHLIGRYE